MFGLRGVKKRRNLMSEGPRECLLGFFPLDVLGFGVLRLLVKLAMVGHHRLDDFLARLADMAIPTYICR